jgi:deoxyuridine 5'-triphosphate nucleotidohydrolase
MSVITPQKKIKSDIDSIRTIFNNNATISGSKISIDSVFSQILTDISITPDYIDHTTIVWENTNALYLMFELYAGEWSKNCLTRLDKQDEEGDISIHKSGARQGRGVLGPGPAEVALQAARVREAGPGRRTPRPCRAPNSIPEFKWKRTLENAVEPTKNIPSDSGYDLTVISKIKELNGVSYYDTGICVEPPTGFYFDVVGRSSISKTGWMLANNIGIIDATYRGSIIVALVRVNDNADEIKLPMRLVQMIPRSLILMNNIEVDSLSDTVRGSGGFGSSG